MSKQGSCCCGWFSGRTRQPELSALTIQSQQQLVKTELANVIKSGEHVEVDEKMLEGRRPNRGFTITNSKHTDDFGIDRRSQRSWTMFENHRRGDHEFSQECIDELQNMHSSLTQRVRRGSLSVLFETVKDDEMLAMQQKISHCFLVGLLPQKQVHGDERPCTFMHGEFVNGRNHPVISCQKGAKGAGIGPPNQDNFSFMQLADGHTMACCFDGHGPDGHKVSARTVRTVPYYFVTSLRYPLDIKGALLDAFQLAQRDLVAYAVEESFDVHGSGTTAVAAVWKGNTLWVANLGDSKCVAASEVAQSVLFQTIDHKPECEEEKKRIEACGGEVRSRTYPDGWTVNRIFVGGSNFPGLCMSRTLGDLCVKDCGVVAVPSVTETKLDLAKKPFLILASDGVWEFLTTNFVAKAVSKKLSSDGPADTVQKLHREARKRWKKEEGDYCDDITTILVKM